MASAHHCAVRRSCHPITGPSGLLVLARQPTTDSRWVDKAMPTTRFASVDRRQDPTASSTLDQIRSASCSTQPDCGEVMPTGALPTLTSCPSAVTSAAFVLVVPWSIVRITPSVSGWGSGTRCSSCRIPLS